MAYNSLLGYAKDGVAEVVASSKTTMSDINTWALDAYRNLKFYSPVTGELKTWLEANAIKCPLTGTWVFNEKLTAAEPPLHTDVAFISNGTEFTNINTGINTGGGNLEPVKSYSLFYNDTKVNSDSAYTGNWVNQAYRTITFTQPVQYEGNEEFVRWFVDNAAPLPIIEKGTYVFKDGLSSGQWTKGSSITQRIVAKSNNTDVSSIILLVGAERTADGLEGFNIEKISYDLNVGGMTKTTQVYFAYAWASAAYKTIEITGDCIVDKQFKIWFDYYTTKQ